MGHATACLLGAFIAAALRPLAEQPRQSQSQQHAAVRLGDVASRCLAAWAVTTADYAASPVVLGWAEEVVLAAGASRMR